MTVSSSTSEVRAWLWLAPGALLVLVHAVLLWLSPAFAYGRPVLERPTVLLVALLMSAGAVYLTTVWMLKRLPCGGRWWWAGMLAAGLLMRLLMLPSTPMLETDFYRYLWDGAVVAHGHNPYRHAPAAVLAREAPELVPLARASEGVISRVNHPELRTIYPPVAQGAFALAHALLPWRIEGLRLVWLLSDLATLALLYALLRTVRVQPAWLLVYWWNPLLVKEAHNSAHMELLLLPFVLGALLLAVRGRHLAGTAALALGASAKLWPALLLPVVLRQRGMRLRTAAAGTAVFGGVVGLLMLPLLLGGLGHASGLAAYASYWQMNDSLYKLLHLAASWLVPRQAHELARAAAGLLLLAWLAWLCRMPAADGREVCTRALWAVAGLFFLSPAQFPWYWLWLLPLLCVRPSPGLLLLTATLPLYYLRFPMRELSLDAWFDHGVVWLQFAPSLALLAWEAARTRRASRNPS